MYQPKTIFPGTVEISLNPSKGLKHMTKTKMTESKQSKFLLTPLRD